MLQEHQTSHHGELCHQGSKAQSLTRQQVSRPAPPALQDQAASAKAGCASDCHTPCQGAADGTGPDLLSRSSGLTVCMLPLHAQHLSVTHGWCRASSILRAVSQYRTDEGAKLCSAGLTQPAAGCSAVQHASWPGIWGDASPSGSVLYSWHGLSKPQWDPAACCSCAL